MATPEMTSCLPTGADRSELEPLSPYTSLHYHFGMLLGEDDFKTDQGYHRAKMRMHNAWLHRAGVVWGFGVSVDHDAGEIHVGAGLALDGAGHELHLENDVCVNVARWFDSHKDDPNFEIKDDAGAKTFSAHVEISFKACLKQQVPALMEPCNNAGTTTAYSRVFETVDVLLKPNVATPSGNPYHRLRLLFGIDEPTLQEGSTDAVPDDQAVLDEIAAIEHKPAAEQPAARLKAFHRFAALDEIDLQRAVDDDERISLFPELETAPVLLADIADLRLQPGDSGSKLTGGAVDTSVRPSHVATTTIQDLLCGQARISSGSETADSGPRIDPASVILLTSKAIEFAVDKELADKSVSTDAFSVTWFDQAQGWERANVKTATYTGTETKTVNLDLETPIEGLVRLIVFGTGPTPLLGADLVPLAGAKGGPPGTKDNGHDFVLMKEFVPQAIVSTEPPNETGDEIATVSATLGQPAATARVKKKASHK